MSSTSPEVDVGIVTWNTADLTTEAIGRLKDVAGDVRLRILVRDNGSSDGTPEAIAARHPDVDLDAGGENLGFAAGMNTLIDRSDAPWFLALNSDAWPQPLAIRRMLDVGATNPGVGAVAPRLERPDGTLEHSTHPFPSEFVAAVMAVGGPRILPGRIAERLLLPPAWDHRRDRDVDWAVGAALLLRREALDEVGGFDERYFMYAEDLAWCHRASRAGWTIRFVADAVVVHVGNASGESRYGSRRTRTYLENTARWFRAEHGTRRERCYSILHALAALRCEVGARRRGDRGEADHWRTVRRVHLARPPAFDTSRPRGDHDTGGGP